MTTHGNCVRPSSGAWARGYKAGRAPTDWLARRTVDDQRDAAHDFARAARSDSRTLNNFARLVEINERVVPRGLAGEPR